MMKIKLNQVCIGSRATKCQRVPDSPNKKMHWATKYKWHKAWKEEVCWSVMENRKAFGKLPLHNPKIRVIERLCKLRDQDNLWASIKAILDGLISAGVIIDDNIKCIHIEVQQIKVPHRVDEGVEIKIDKEYIGEKVKYVF